VITCDTYRPEKSEGVADVYAAHKDTVITYGAGRSYGDAALNKKGVLISKRLNRFLQFDKGKGILRAEAGVTLAEILDVVVPQGWILPVIPGTKFVSLGGALASNVHGKNAYKEGEFASHVRECVLQLSSGKKVACSPTKNADIFWATAGGMGMTGTIVEVEVKLKKIASLSLDTVRYQAGTIEELLEGFKKYRNADYMIGWIDHFAKGKKLGRGVFEAATHASAKHGKKLDAYKIAESGVTIPSFFPSFVLNKYSMAIYNCWRFSGVSRTALEGTQTFEEFFHPLDGIGHWNRLYGKKGFLQYQCLIPDDKDAAKNVRAVLEMIQKSGLFSFLAVIKYHAARKGDMSFGDKGYSLALDFPNTKAVHTLLDAVDKQVLKMGGRVYLAKDARMKRSVFEKMYAAALPAWRKMLKQLDPKKQVHSAMSERLGFRKAGK
jgi:FAD/FMN-containing dehydrogenase